SFVISETGKGAGQPAPFPKSIRCRQCVVLVVLLLLLVTATRIPARTAAAPIPINAASEKNGALGPAAAAGGSAAAGATLLLPEGGGGAGASEAAPPDVAPPDVAPPDVAPPLSSCAKALAVAEKSKAPPAKIDNNFRCMALLPQGDVTAESH
ncbi:MAG TPA: hypothetical protein VMF67_18090, partial [Rhizomicrobium sp.]|nr:hypothetical protein [Rhizomicrobium sp.]